MEPGHRLTRSESDRMVVGVCGGLGEHFGIDSNLVRIVFVLLSVFGGSGVVIYLALWLIVPRASKVEAMPRDVVRDGFEEGRRMANDGAQAAKRGYRRMRGTPPGADDAPPDPPTDPQSGPPSDPPTDPPSPPSGPR